MQGTFRGHTHEQSQSGLSVIKQRWLGHIWRDNGLLELHNSRLLMLSLSCVYCV